MNVNIPPHPPTPSYVVPGLGTSLYILNIILNQQPSQGGLATLQLGRFLASNGHHAIDMLQDIIKLLVLIEEPFTGSPGFHQDESTIVELERLEEVPTYQYISYTLAKFSKKRTDIEHDPTLAVAYLSLKSLGLPVEQDFPMVSTCFHHHRPSCPPLQDGAGRLVHHPVPADAPYGGMKWKWALHQL